MNWLLPRHGLGGPTSQPDIVGEGRLESFTVRKGQQAFDARYGRMAWHTKEARANLLEKGALPHFPAALPKASQMNAMTLGQMAQDAPRPCVAAFVFRKRHPVRKKD